MRGYFFVMFLALRVYFGVLTRRLEEDLTNEISVEEVFYELSKVEWIKGPEDDVVVIAVCTDFADAVTLDADVRGVANLRFNSRLSFVSNENLVTGIAADIGRGAVERDDLSAELVPPESTGRNPICSIRRKHLRLGCANGDHTGFNGTREADLDMFGAVTRDQSIIQAFLIVRPNGKTAVLHIGDGGLCPNAVYTSMTGRWMRGLHIGQGDVADRFVAVKS